MKTITAYCFLILSFLTLLIASSPRLMDALDWLPSPYLYGDLYMYSNLKLFKNSDSHKHCPAFITSHPKLNTVNVFVLGDSYVDRINHASFNVNHYTFFHWDNGSYTIPTLDTQKKNILIIETTERYLRKRFPYPANDHILISSSYVPLKNTTEESSLFKIKAEDNLTYLLTYNSLVYFFKEMKAWINLRLFDRTDKNVSLSKDHKHIFFKETTDSTLITSSFYPLSDMQLDSLVQNINTTYHHFISAGFSQVYLTIIPNTVNLIDPAAGTYNHLIERLEKSPKLEMPVIDLYETFKQNPDNYFYNSDTHWNCEGSSVWLKKADSIFYSFSKQ